MSTEIAYTTEVMYNQPWKCKYIVGDWVGIYIGEGVEALYIAKAHAREVNIADLYRLYELICYDHNFIISEGHRYKPKKKSALGRLRAYIKLRFFTPKYEYNYTADMDYVHPLNVQPKNGSDDVAENK